MLPPGKCVDCNFGVMAVLPDGRQMLQCRAGPPQVTVIVVPVQSGPSIANPLAVQKNMLTTQAVTAWPTMSDTDGCWQFLPEGASVYGEPVVNRN